MKRACILAAAAVLAAVASAEEKIKIGGLVGPHPDFDKHPELLSPSVRAKIDRARRSLPRYEDTGSNNYTYKAGFLSAGEFLFFVTCASSHVVLLHHAL